jgi:hypothetical protein
MPRYADLGVPAIPRTWPLDDRDTDAPGRLPVGTVCLRRDPEARTVEELARYGSRSGIFKKNEVYDEEVCVEILSFGIAGFGSDRGCSRAR